MYREVRSGWIKHIDFTLLDILCLEASFVMAYIIRLGWRWPFRDDAYLRLDMILLLSHICVVFFLNSYQNIVRRGYWIEIKSVVKHDTLLLLMVMAYLFVMKQSVLYSRTVVLLTWGIACFIMIPARLVWKRLVRLNLMRRRNERAILVVANTYNIEQILNTLGKEYYADFRVTGIALVDAQRTGEKVYDIPVVAARDTLLEYVRQNIIDEVFIDLPGKEKYTEQILNYLINMGVTVHINTYPFARNIETKVVENFAGYTVFTVGTKFASSGQLLAKRLMDIVGALAGLLLTGVLALIFGPIIKKQSPGPIFFEQKRVGRNGRIFRIYKFRSMYPDAEERKKELMSQNKMQGQMFKMDDDPRIIPIGRFMRRTSLDEFPQFWNVLKGDMSLVGTRPPTVEEYEQYELHHKKRLAAKPGITGMWQTSGRSNIVDFEKVVELDAKYISEWSLSLDVKILWKTVVMLFKQEGAV